MYTDEGDFVYRWNGLNIVHAELVDEPSTVEELKVVVDLPGRELLTTEVVLGMMVVLEKLETCLLFLASGLGNFTFLRR